MRVNHLMNLFNQNYVYTKLLWHWAVNALRLGFKTNNLMQYMEVMAVFPDIHTNYTNAVHKHNEWNLVFL
jgi:hypothetical protein